MSDQGSSGRSTGDAERQEDGDVNSVSWTGEGGDEKQGNGAVTYKRYQRLANNLRKLKAELTLSDFLMIFLTAVIAFSTAWNTWYVGGQLAEMRSSSQDTKNLVIATQHLADRAHDQASALDKLTQAGRDQAKATGDLKDITKAQADKIAGLYGAIKSGAEASGKAAGATLAQSKATQAEAESVRGQTSAVEKALHATQDMADATRTAAKASEKGNEIANTSYIAANRPWVGVDTIDAIGEPTKDQDFHVNIVVRNMGHGPALNARGYFYPAISPLVAEAVPALQECKAGCSSTTILPNGPTGYNVYAPKETLTEAEMKKITAGTDVIFFFGRIDYLDSIGQHYWTTYCAYWHVGHHALSTCNAGNDAH